LIVPLPIEDARSALKELEDFDLCVEERDFLYHRLDIASQVIDTAQVLIASKDSINQGLRQVIVLHQELDVVQVERYSDLESRARKWKWQRDLAGILLGIAASYITLTTLIN